MHPRSPSAVSLQIVHDETALVLFEGEIFKPEEWKQA